MRTRMVTRTIKESFVNTMVANTEKGEVEYTTVRICGTYSDKKQLEKIVKKAVETETIKFACIMDIQVYESIYGMPEDEFMKYAVPVER